jgi:hypothetical protein
MRKILMKSFHHQPTRPISKRHVKSSAMFTIKIKGRNKIFEKQEFDELD